MLLTLLAAPAAQAKCTINPDMRSGDTHAAPIRFGRVNLASAHLQPPSSLIASTVVPPTDYTVNGINANTILWTCDKADLDTLHFLVSTNGDSRFGGHNDVGGPDGLTHVYGTAFNRVGLRLTMDGVTLTRRWRRVPLRDHVTISLGKRQLVGIRLKDIPVLHAELYRVRTITPNRGNFGGCGAHKGLDPKPGGTNYRCVQPNAYVQLAGFGKDGHKHDREGEDHNDHYQFWFHNNGFAYSMYQVNTLIAQPTCAVKSATPHVQFATVSVAQMMAGHTVSAPVDVSVECDDRAESGLSHNQVSLGIQVSPGAWRAAQQLGLVNSAGGVAALVSDAYGLDASLAQGIGISLASAQTGRRIRFVGQSNAPAAANPTNAGWHPVLEDAHVTTSPGGTPSAPGHSHYQRRYTATLHRLPGRTVTAGRVHATAYVVVKVQ